MDTETHEQKQRRLERRHRELRDRATTFPHATHNRQVLEAWTELQNHIKSRFKKKKTPSA